MKTAVKTKRLLKLADFLEKLPRKRFGYDTWISSPEDLLAKGTEDDLKNCGTTACALGWACVMPEFRRLGLRMVDFEPCTQTSACPLGAAQEIFGLTLDESSYLFVPNNYNGWKESPLERNATAKQVARHIRKFATRRAQGLPIAGLDEQQE